MIQKHNLNTSLQNLKTEKQRLKLISRNPPRIRTKELQVCNVYLCSVTNRRYALIAGEEKQTAQTKTSTNGKSGGAEALTMGMANELVVVHLPSMRNVFRRGDPVR